MVAFAYIDCWLDVECQHCGNVYNIMFNKKDMINWNNKKFAIEDALHYLSIDERELLLSSTCGKCFDLLYSAAEDDD